MNPVMLVILWILLLPPILMECFSPLHCKGSVRARGTRVSETGWCLTQLFTEYQEYKYFT